METMKALVYKGSGKLALEKRPLPRILEPEDVIVKVTLAAICSSDLHIKHGTVPRAVSNTILGHEFVGIVDQTGPNVKKFKPGDRVAVNVETFCGDCFFCKQGFVNNCISQNGGWALGCRIDGGQAEYARVPYGDNGLTLIPESVSDEEFAAKYGWADEIINPQSEDALDRIMKLTGGRGADVVFEVAGAPSSFELAWKAARPNAIVGIVAMYEEAQILPLPSMYGKNLTFKTGGVDANACGQIMELIACGKLNALPLITHKAPLDHIIEAYDNFEKQANGVIKYAISV